MTAIVARGIIRNGRVEVEEPINLPDGSKVIVQLPDADFEADWDNSPQGIAEWLKWCDALQPLQITAEEEEDAAAWLNRLQKEDT